MFDADAASSSTARFMFIPPYVMQDLAVSTVHSNCVHVKLAMCDLSSMNAAAR
jgi:hypothetical protein